MKNPTESISHLEDHLGFWLRFVSNHVSGRFKFLMELNGASVSEWVVMRLLFPKAHVSPTALIDALGMTKGAVSKIVTRLEDKGFVERVSVEGDRRATQVVLTASGRALVPKLAALADQNDEDFFGHLDPAKRAELMDIMKMLVIKHRLKQIPME